MPLQFLQLRTCLCADSQKGGLSLINTQIAREAVVFFYEVQDVIPGKPAQSKVKEWTRRGVVGAGGISHRIEWCKIGRRSATSLEAYYRFLDRVNGLLPPLEEDVSRYRESQQKMEQRAIAGAKARWKKK